MSQEKERSAPKTSSDMSKPFDEDTIKKMVEVFPAELIKQREGNEYTDKSTGAKKKMMFDYVESAVVNERLNDVFSHAWSFRIVSKEIISNDYYPSDGDGEPQKEAIVHGSITAWGITHEAVGAQPTTSYTEGFGNAYKGAISECIKLCAKKFGIGLHLWMKSGGANSSSDEPVPMTESQIKFLESLRDSEYVSEKTTSRIENCLSTKGVTKNLASQMIDVAKKESDSNRKKAN